MAPDQQIDIDGFAQYLSKKGKQPATIESYCSDMRGFVDYAQKSGLPIKMIELNTLVHFQQYLKEHDELPNSIRRKVIGIRQFYRYMADTKKIQASPFDAIAIPERSELRIKSEKIKKIDDHINTSPLPQSFKAKRDLAALCLLGLEGLKVSELVLLTWADILLSPDCTSVRVPGQRQRTISIDPLASRCLMIYREAWIQETQNQAFTKVFVGFKGRDASLVLPEVTRHGVKHMIYEIGNSLGIKHLNAETLRHLAIDHLIAKGLSSEAIMNHLGLRAIGNIAKHFKATHES